MTDHFQVVVEISINVKITLESFARPYIAKTQPGALLTDRRRNISHQTKRKHPQLGIVGFHSDILQIVLFVVVDRPIDDEAGGFPGRYRAPFNTGNHTGLVEIDWR